MPVVEAGLSELYEDGYEPVPGVQTQWIGGHTPGHMLFYLHSNGQEALMCFDILYHCLQVVEPGLATRFSNDADEEVEARQRVLQRVADTGCLLFNQHNPFPCAMRIKSTSGAGYEFELVEQQS